MLIYFTYLFYFRKQRKKENVQRRELLLKPLMFA